MCIRLRLTMTRGLFIRCLSNLIVLGLLSAISACGTAKQYPTTPPANPLPSYQSTAIVPATQEPKSFNHIKRLCEDTHHPSTDLSNIGGSLVYFSDHGVIAIDISTGKIRQLKSLQGNTIFFSKDGSTIADFGNGDTLEIIDKEKDLTFTIPPHTYLDSFLSDGRVLLGTSRAPVNNYTGDGITDSIFVLVPKDGEITQKSIFLPHFNQREGNTGSGTYTSYVKYSPSLEYVIYPSSQDSGKNSILNITDGSITTFEWFEYQWTDPSPFWRPDGKAITIMMPSKTSENFNFYNVSLGGQITQLTHIEDIVSGGYDLEGMPTWSPNGRYLAFPIYLESINSEGTLFILDTTTGTVYDICLTRPWPQMNYGWVWSPDSKYIALNVVEDGIIQNDVEIIGLESESVFDVKIEPNHGSGKLLGWLNWDIP